MPQVDYQLGLPARMKALALDGDGHPVPWFVQFIDGAPDFRVMDLDKLHRAIRQNLCWVCGQEMGEARGTFVIGPMCAVNRTTAEPPSHYDCAVYSATRCPFLNTPRRKRRAKDLPAHRDPAGLMIPRNPGVTLVWTSRKWRVFKVPQRHIDAGMGAGILFDIGEPVRVNWYREGRPATAPEILNSIHSGLPAIRNVAESEGPEAVVEFEGQVQKALRLVELTAVQ